MKTILSRVFYVLSAFTLFATSAKSQTQQVNDTSQALKRYSILNNKYHLLIDPAAKLSPRVADIMAADPNENRETRIILESGSDKLVFFAQEVFALGGKTLWKDISGEVEPEFNFSRKIILETDSIQAILSTPTLFNTSSPAILINSLLVRSHDNTVSRIDVFINPEAYGSREKYIKMSERVFSSITPGNRRVELKERTELHKIFGTNAQFSFKLPENYYVTVDEKYDFSVLYLKKYKKSILDTVYTGITIYAGTHPNFLHGDYGYVISKATKSPGQFIQVPIEWLYFKDDAQSFYLKEQILPADMINKGLVLHLAMLTNKKDMIEELNKIIESIKLVK